MQIDYIDPAEIFVEATYKAPFGSILFQSLSGPTQAPRLIASVPDPHDSSDLLTVYVKLADPDDGGFQFEDASIDDAAVGVVGWRIEVDPRSARHPQSVTPNPGDILRHRDAWLLMVLNDQKQLRGIELSEFRSGPSPRPSATSAGFSNWRIVKDVARKKEPVVVYEHVRPRGQ